METSADEILSSVCDRATSNHLDRFDVDAHKIVQQIRPNVRKLSA